METSGIFLLLAAALLSGGILLLSASFFLFRVHRVCRSFPRAIESGFNRYADFSGRSSRSEYWWWTLFVLLGVFGFGVLDVLSGVSAFFSLFVIAVLLPSLVVSIRRLHDVDESGWWVLIGVIPIIGFLALTLLWFTRAGDKGPNRWSW